MYITENIQTHLDKNELTAGVFINMRRAFDTVDNDILLTKLDHYGIRGLFSDWFCSYLNGRQGVAQKFWEDAISKKLGKHKRVMA